MEVLMYAIYAIAGGILGIFAGSAGGSILLGAVLGVVIGILLVRLNLLDKRIDQMAATIRTLRRSKRLSGEKRPEERPPEPVEPAPEPPWPAPETADPLTGHPKPAPEQAWADTWTARHAAEPVEEALSVDSALQDMEAERGESPERPGEKALDAPGDAWASYQPSVFDKLLPWIKNWITTGNVPVKVGVIVSFIGVSFLLKYAIDRELVAIPLEIRLLAVALAGAALIAAGWRLRERMRVYALSLQGGGAGILFLTIFAALRLWEFLPASLAFILLLALTIFMGALAVLQNSRSLAILGIVGGFLAPILTSTGQGSHVVLFSYYLVLNGAILGIAWFRAWRELNLVGCVFTFLISGFWGYQYFKPALFASTEPFLVLYFLFYQAIAILYALRQPPERLGVVDGTLVFGTPVIAFALQSALVRGTEYGLAISAAGAAIFYAFTATGLFRKKGDYLKLLTESYLALAVAFATIAIPLALDARWTSAAWALEGAALVWVGVRQGRQLANLAGSLLIILSGFAFAASGWRHDIDLPLLNGNVLGGLLISSASFFASRRLESFDAEGFESAYRLAATMLFAWGALWWVGTGWMETADRLVTDTQAPVFLLFTALSTAAAVWLGRNRSWRMMQLLSLGFLPVLLLLATQGWTLNDHLLMGLGWLAWPVAIGIQGIVMRDLDERQEALAVYWHIATLFLLTAMLAHEAWWWTDRIASDAWAGAAVVSTIGLIALLVWRFRNHPQWPVPVHRPAYLASSVFLVAGQVTGLAFLSMLQAGNPEPFPYVPLLNPFGLAMLFAMVTAMLSLRVMRLDWANGAASTLAEYVSPYRLLLAIAFFIMTTAALVRGVHHYSSVPWRFDALFDSLVVQTALSIYWGLLGFSGMILGARTRRRLLWLIGAGFMALVVIKLFLVDLGNTGTLERIISFIGIGALLLLVGYLAPVPPKDATHTATDDEAGQEKHED
jgi:uncharacterized membrane protein